MKFPPVTQQLLYLLLQDFKDSPFDLTFLFFLVLLATQRGHCTEVTVIFGLIR